MEIENVWHYTYIYIRLKTGDSRLINGLSNKTKRCTCRYTISDVLSLYCIFDVQNLVLCLNREIIKIIDYKFMLKLQCKTNHEHFKSVLPKNILR
jgi:hypothetical protein